MFGPREMLLSSQEPVVRQFLNARRQGPIGMAEEKDAAELEAEKDEEEGPPLPPIPPQILPSSGQMRKTQPEPGRWLRENSVTPPGGSFTGHEDYGDPDAPPVKGPSMAPDATSTRDRVEVADSAKTAAPRKVAAKTTATKTTAAKKPAAKTTATRKAASSADEAASEPRRRGRAS
jgi:hypothetical protein